MVHNSDSKCHTDRPVLHVRMACWLHLSLCKYVFGISSSSRSRNSTSSVAVLSSLHCAWSMCFIIVYSVVAAVVAGDMGAIACAAPAEENEVGFTGATPGFMYKGGGGSRSTRYTICLSQPGELRSTRSQRRRRRYWHSRVRVLPVLPVMGTRFAWQKQVPDFPHDHVVCASLLLLFNRTSSLTRSRC